MIQRCTARNHCIHRQIDLRLFCTAPCSAGSLDNSPRFSVLFFALCACPAMADVRDVLGMSRGSAAAASSHQPPSALSAHRPSQPPPTHPPTHGHHGHHGHGHGHARDSHGISARELAQLKSESFWAANAAPIAPTLNNLVGGMKQKRGQRQRQAGDAKHEHDREFDRSRVRGCGDCLPNETVRAIFSLTRFALVFKSASAVCACLQFAL